MSRHPEISPDQIRALRELRARHDPIDLALEVRRREDAFFKEVRKRGQEHRVHSLFGDLPLVCNSYHHPAEGRGRKGRQPDGAARPHEIKVDAVFTRHPVADQKPWRELDSTTYVATTQQAEPCGQMMRNAFLRRFPDPPAPVAFLGDGAAWNWELQRVCFPLALGSVDYYHAAEHVTGVVDLIEDHHTPSGRKRRRRWVKLLLRGRLDVCLDQARRTFPPDQAEAGEKALDCFENTRERMRYGYCRNHGYFISSGVVEAACKTLVAQRLKGSGRHWSERGLSHILSTRTALLSHHDDEFWISRLALASTAA